MGLIYIYIYIYISPLIGVNGGMVDAKRLTASDDAGGNGLS
jgi:hypothetical protein